MAIAARATTFTYGTIGNDIITAQYLYGDMIDGLAGDDVITGLAGNDLLLGNAGRDTLFGMDGFDTLDGGAGSDKLYGGAGDDILRPDSRSIANDVVDGGDGSDTLDYSTAPVTRAVRVNLGVTGTQDTLGAGKDTIVNVENVTGTSFADTLTGNALANTLKGGAGSDTLQGLAGNDFLFGGAGNDKLYGGDGADSINPDDGGIGNDYIDGGLGYNTLSYLSLGGTMGVRVDLNLTTAQNTGGAGIDTILNINAVVGSINADTFIGTSRDDYFNGDYGNDTFTGGAGNDTLLGGSGNYADTIDGGDGDDRMNGGDGADILNGGAGIDRIRGGGGADVMTGGGGGDLFYLSGSPFGADSTIASLDRITDFNTAEDQFILQSFNWTALSSYVATADFSAAGIAQVRATGDAGLQQVQVDYDGNGSVDLAVEVNIVGSPLTAANFQLLQVTDF